MTGRQKTLSEVEIPLRAKGEGHTLKINRQDVLDAMKDLEPEKTGVPDFHYRGRYVLHPDTNKRYGIKKVTTQIIKMKTSIKTTDFTTNEIAYRLKQLGFICGDDKNARKGL